jgi:hypothetical protein
VTRDGTECHAVLGRSVKQCPSAAFGPIPESNDAQAWHGIRHPP